jgi:hypothetical protein
VIVGATRANVKRCQPLPADTTETFLASADASVAKMTTLTPSCTATAQAQSDLAELKSRRDSTLESKQGISHTSHSIQADSAHWRASTSLGEARRVVQRRLQQPTLVTDIHFRVHRASHSHASSQSRTKAIDDTSLLDLPDELLLRILGCLAKVDRESLGATCVKLATLVLHSSLNKRLSFAGRAISLRQTRSVEDRLPRELVSC